MKNIKGFTLVELVIVIIIVGILSIVSVPIYQSYVKRACLTEAKALIGQIITAQNIYYTEYGHYANEGSVNENLTRGKLLDIDISGNKYFTDFRSESNSANWFGITLHPSSAVPGNIQYVGYFVRDTASGRPGKTIIVFNRDGTEEYL